MKFIILLLLVFSILFSSKVPENINNDTIIMEFTDNSGVIITTQLNKSITTQNEKI